jgi:glycosyltransferase involved in cell wall biosynthesis
VDRPLVSVVTTSYDQARYLEETLASVRTQDYPRIEHLVIDDGSTDGSAEIVRAHANELAWWHVQENAGQVAALNRAFAHARGDVLGFVSGDDALLPGAVSRVVERFERDPELLLVYGDMVYVDEASRQVGYVHAVDWDPSLAARTARQFAPQPATFWSRRAWELAGPFNERSWALFDEELFLRVASAGPVARIPEALAAFRLHPDSKQMSRRRRMAEECARFADEFFGGDDLPPALRPHARAGRAGFYRRAALALYADGEIAEARRLFLRSLALSPRGASRKQLERLARTLVPERLVRRRRARSTRR